MKMHAAGSLLTEPDIVSQSGQRNVASVTMRLFTAARSAVWGLVRWQQVRRDIGELKRLDDRLLADIGISRSEIEAGVRLGRWSKHNADLDRLATVVE